MANDHPTPSTSPHPDERLSMMLDTVPAFLSYVDCDCCYQIVSKHYEAYFKRPRSEILGHHMREIIGERAWQLVEPAMEQALRGEAATFQASLDVPGLGRRYSRGTFTPDFDATGAVRGVVVLMEDVTDRRKHDAQLKEKEAYYRSVFDSPGVSNVETDPLTGQILRANRKFCALLGYPDTDSMRHLSIIDLVHPEDSANLAEQIDPLRSGRVESVQLQIRYLRKDGLTVWADVAVTTLRDADGKPHRMLVTAHDITSKVEAERALRETEERVRLAVTAAGIGYWSEDPKTGRATLDSICAELFGVGTETSEQAVFERIVDEDRERVRKAFYDSFVGENPYHAEFRVRAPDGSIRWLMGLGDIVRDSTGKIVKLYGVNIDISARKHAEELLTEADRRKDEFLATLAHELRNPLAPISNALQLWPRLENQPEQLRSIRAMMQRQVTQLKHLIDDLLDISRISRGKIELRKEPLALHDILDSAIESIRPVIDAAGHSLLVDLPDTPLMLTGDRGRLTQILGNIIHNSAKYTPTAGTITVSARTEGEFAVISIQDTGVGIPAEMLQSIFEPFTQVDRSLERAQGGLGIGLTLVKKLVELHGGTIEARSEGIGKGSEFIVRLPLHAPAPRLRAPLDSRESSSGTVIEHLPTDPLPRHRVLVVDDLRSSADTMGMMLEHLGQETRVAYDGEAALRAVESFHPDLVISDVAMPGMDGYHLAAELRRRYGAAMTLAALTGYGQESDRERVMAAGFDHHLVKPAGIESLCELLAQAPGSVPQN